MKDRPFFCTLPWTGLDISAQGTIKPCCKFSTGISKNLLDYEGNDVLLQVRKTFLEGGKPEQCKRCWQDEDAGLPSKRQLDHQYVLAPDTTLDHVKVLALTFGNVCNLACVTCSSASSSRWAADERKLNAEFPHLKLYAHDQHYRSSNFVDAIIDRCEQLRHLEISGGEPFFSDRNLHLDLLARIPRPENVKIHYITNCTIFPDSDFWQIWRKFRHIDIQLSLDATHERFEYLRYPASWSDVWQNVQKYRSCPDIQLSISHTVSWINVLGLDQFISWCVRENLPRPYIGPVSRPEFLSVKSLPTAAKQHVRANLSQGKHVETQKILEYMSTDTADCFDQGKKWLQALDRLRHSDCLTVFPELQPILDLK